MRSNRLFYAMPILWVGIVLFFIFLAPSACTSAPDVQKVLAPQGYTRIEATGYRFFGCSKDDAWHTGFRATAPNGQQVTGVVCSGILKGKTVRFD